MCIYIGGAWPYANGPLHLGHIASLLPGDILARYYRLRNKEVIYVSGSDCHGTPIAIRAKNEGIAYGDVTNRYHSSFMKVFHQLGFSYDLYTRTDDAYHKELVRNMVSTLWENGYIYEQETLQLYCELCSKRLPDRYVEGNCPHCNAKARGDQCEQCNTLLDPLELNNRTCKICKSAPTEQTSKQLFFALSRFQDVLDKHLREEGTNWRENSIHETMKYLSEGLRDRGISRDLEWGIKIPIEGYEEETLYVWFDAVLGYYTAFHQFIEKKGLDPQTSWDKATKRYFVHGKDNIPFHTIIFPALLEALGYSLEGQQIVSSEYLTIEGKKISTSNQWAIWAEDLLEEFQADLVRYFLMINGPEKRDSDFSMREFKKSINGELVGAYGNFVNRTMAFIEKYYEDTVPIGKVSGFLGAEIKNLYKIIGELIEAGKIKMALEKIFAFIRCMNKYFDQERPWITIQENPDKCRNTMASCAIAIVHISSLLEPFLPFSSQKIRNWFGFEVKWEYWSLDREIKLQPHERLFNKVEDEAVERILSKL